MGNLIMIVGLIVAIASIICWFILLTKKEGETRALIPMWIGIAAMWIGRALM